MGCITSKKAVSIRPTLDKNNSSSRQGQDQSKFSVGNSGRRKSGRGFGRNYELDDSWRRPAVNRTRLLSLPVSNIHNHIEAEQVAAGWPSWLSSVAGEAIQGWVPMQADAFQRLDVIGQGTYSQVFQARKHATGTMYALKKVRFDTHEPVSVKFMAREIQILRRLDHPNVIKLEGVITSQNSKSIYLVFEYMDHDIAGLIGCNIFSEPQVKCYMHQFLSGLEHCHSRSVMHRDIKCANLLVNNDGCLKIADFGLASYFGPTQKQPLTSRVVTLWYRPPELILGSTNYVESVDLWSVGCVFAELFLGKPILDGRTEIEQLHKIFKLCGSPPEDYWKNIKMSNASIFKSRCHHEGNLKKICKDFPEDAVNLLEKFLSVDSKKRGTASDALNSVYFRTKPYACNPSSLPKYRPTKEMDAQICKERLRKGWSGRFGFLASHNSKTIKVEENERNKESHNVHVVENNDMNSDLQNKLNRSAAKLLADLQGAPEANSQAKDIYAEKAPHGYISFSGPLQIPSSSGFGWAKKTRESNASLRPCYKTSYYPLARNTVVNSEDQHRNGSPRNKQLFSNRNEPLEERRAGAAFNQKVHLKRHTDSFDAYGMFNFEKKSYVNDVTSGMSSNSLDYLGEEKSKVDFSGPLLCQTHEVDELLENHEWRISKAMRQILFKRESKHGR